MFQVGPMAASGLFPFFFSSFTYKQRKCYPARKHEQQWCVKKKKRSKKGGKRGKEKGEKRKRYSEVNAKRKKKTKKEDLFHSRQLVGWVGHQEQGPLWHQKKKKQLSVNESAVSFVVVDVVVVVLLLFTQNSPRWSLYMRFFFFQSLVFLSSTWEHSVFPSWNGKRSSFIT